MKRVRIFHPSYVDGEETTTEELLSPKLLCVGRSILEAGIDSDLLMIFVTGVIESLQQSPSDVLIAKLKRLMQVAEGDIKDKLQQKRDAIRTQESTRKYREEKQQEQEADRRRLWREKCEQAVQAEQNDSSG